MKTQEIKVAESLVNLMDDHWFNATIFGHYLAQQPLYTIDRIMEMVVSVISEQAKMYQMYSNQGTFTEGLMLANELNECIKAYQENNQLNNLKLPSRYYKVMREEPVKEYKLGWVHNEYENSSQINVQAVIM